MGGERERNQSIRRAVPSRPVSASVALVITHWRSRPATQSVTPSASVGSASLSAACEPQDAADLLRLVGRHPLDAHERRGAHQPGRHGAQIGQQRQHGLPGRGDHPAARRPHAAVADHHHRAADRGARAAAPAPRRTGRRTQVRRPPPAPACVQACTRPVSTATRAPVAAARSASTCAVHRPPISVTSYGTGPVDPDHCGRPSASTPMITPSSPTGQRQGAQVVGGHGVARVAGPSSPRLAPAAPSHHAPPLLRLSAIRFSPGSSERQRRQHAGQLLTVQPHQPHLRVPGGVLQRPSYADQFGVATRRSPGHGR